MGTGPVEESSVAVWVGDVSLTLSAPVHIVRPTPVGTLTHGPCLDGNDQLPRHISRVYYFVGMSCGRWCSRDDYSHIGESSDAKR